MAITQKTTKATAPKTSTKKSVAKRSRRKLVLIRTYSAGVHFGELVSRKGKEVELANARRIWRWKGANSLNEIANSGIDSAAESNYSRVSEAVPSVILTEAIEVLAMTPAAFDRCATAGWSKQ